MSKGRLKIFNLTNYVLWAADRLATEHGGQRHIDKYCYLTFKKFAVVLSVSLSKLCLLILRRKS